MMDTQIFNLNLSVYATSAYIVICSLVSDGLSPTPDKIAARWTSREELLKEGINELAAWRVIEPGRTAEGESLLAPNPASLWRTPGSPKD